jgi:AGZA family xanthine/uracil permease-like MFS transporter
MLLTPLLKNLNFENVQETMPAMFTVIMIPFTYSIADGAALGYCFMLSWVIAGKWREITPVMWVMIILSIFQVIANLLYSVS